MLDDKILQTLGLSPIASKLYLTALGLGTVSVQQLATSAAIKRPTAYNYIEELIRTGWFEQVSAGKKLYYRATNPQQLEHYAQQNLATIQQALPELLAIHAKTGGVPDVSVLTGARALAQLHGDIAQANTIRFWSNLYTFEKLFPDATSQLSGHIQHNQIRVREIIPNTITDKRSAKRYAAIAGKTYSYRVAARGALFGNNVIYNDTVLLFRLYEHNLSVIRLNDASIATSLSTLFDLAWQSAGPAT